METNILHGIQHNDIISTYNIIIQRVYFLTKVS